MAALKTELRHGVYYDSIMLMKAQSKLLRLPGVIDAAILMGTKANKTMLAQRELAFAEMQEASSDDLIIVIRAQDENAAQLALDQVDGFLAAGDSGRDQEFNPKSLKMAVHQLPQARWVLISVAGRYAADVAFEALQYDKNVFLFSDNVPIAEEIKLKQTAAEKGLLVLGPDCGTAWINGIGLGFANRVRKGPVGLVAASGTGLQYVGSRVHQLGSGVSHALGIGSRDPSESVGGVMAHQCLDLLARNEETKVIVLVFKPPSPQVADELLEAARLVGKPVVVDFIGHSGRSTGNLHFVTTLDEAAELAVNLAESGADQIDSSSRDLPPFAPGQQYLRGLFSGGTLAYEVLSILAPQLPGISSNVSIHNVTRLQNGTVSQGHTIIDLGDDEFTVGRLHPMIDNELRIKRMLQEANDPQTAVLLLDVVLGLGAHLDPASELAPAIAQAKALAVGAGRALEVVVLVVGTDDDPQGLANQMATLANAGAHVETSNLVAVNHALRLLQTVKPAQSNIKPRVISPVDMAALSEPVCAINIGLPIFMESLIDQGAEVVQVDWQPPAGGDEKLAAILKKIGRE